MAQREFPESPLVGVGAVVVDEDGRVLLVRRATEPMRGQWSIPGGLIELGESLHEALVREVQEETGLIVEPQAIVEAVDRIYRSSDDKKSRIQFHYVVLDYWCSILGGLLSPSSDVSEVAWVSRVEWNDSNVYSLESVTVRVIERGWQLAQEGR